MTYSRQVTDQCSNMFIRCPAMNIEDMQGKEGFQDPSLTTTCNSIFITIFTQPASRLFESRISVVRHSVCVFVGLCHCLHVLGYVLVIQFFLRDGQNIRMKRIVIMMPTTILLTMQPNIESKKHKYIYTYISFFSGRQPTTTVIQ